MLCLLGQSNLYLRPDCILQDKITQELQFMKNFMLVLLGLSLGMTFSTAAQAEVDLEACIGAWLFDEGKGNKAVSYTHLTLPTNREV